MVLVVRVGKSKKKRVSKCFDVYCVLKQKNQVKILLYVEKKRCTKTKMPLK